MKTIKLGVFMALLLIIGSVQGVNAQNAEGTNVIVVSSLDEVSNMATSEDLSLKFTHSLNLASSETIKEMAIEEFKSMAASKGYTHVYIDEEATKRNTFELRKRNRTYTVVGKAFK